MASEIILVNRSLITVDKSLLMLRRSANDSYRPHAWEFPGGKLDPNEDIDTGLKREVYEECGLEIERKPGFPYVEDNLVQSGKYTGRLYVALFHASELIGGTLTLSEEHDDARWATNDAIHEHEMTPECKRAFIALRGSGVT